MAWVIWTTPNVPFLMEGFEDSEGGSKETVRWSSYIEELNSSNSLSLEPILTKNGSVGKQARCASPMRYLVLDRIGSSYVVPTVLSYVSSDGEKYKVKP